MKTIQLTDEQYRALQLLFKEIDANDDVIYDALDNQTKSEVEGAEFSQNIDGAIAAITNAK